MSTLYLGTDAESLADRLAKLVEETVRTGDGFAPVLIIVPTHYLGKWLRLHLARQFGAAVNLRFFYLETAAWQLLQDLDPRPGKVERLDEGKLRFMILSLLMDEEDGASLAPLRAYLQRRAGGPPREFWRRCWQLADRLTGLIRDYEYHRQEDLIRRWTSDRAQETADSLGLEHGQRELFRCIMGRGGLRDRLGAQSGTSLRTLAQYALEIMGLSPTELEPLPGPERVHLFGITQMSVLHLRIVRWLGARYDLRLYHLNPLCGRLGSNTGGKAFEAMRSLADRYRAAEMRRNGALAGEGMVALWGQAGAESLWIAADLLDGPRPFGVEIIAAGRRSRGSVLGHLQDHILGREAEGETCRLPQDSTVRILACPGIYREVEITYHSILDNLRRDKNLKQTDIAVLVSDMPRYRPVLRAVFDRRPRRLLYNLADFSAAELSVLGHALLGLLDLALESFTRSRVFATLLNPCFLARLGVDREQAATWLEWAETLGIYHGWDRKDRQERGYSDTPLYCWRLGLQRLRLGRIMDVPDEDADAPPLHYQQVVPFADLASGDKEQLDAFCRAVEGLLPTLARLRDWRGSGAKWAEQIRGLVHAFLAVPSDRPGEEEVRGEILEELSRLEELDRLNALRDRNTPLPLALVREFIQDSLAGRFGTKGEYLTGGVTISALQPLRPVPFEIIYVLGLGEGLFPGSDAQSALDLRSLGRRDGDIRLPESNRFLLLEALLAARRKVYLLYNSRDLQDDTMLYPCSSLNQLRRYLEQQIVDAPFEPISVPLSGNDLRYLTRADGRQGDGLANYSEFERLLAVTQSRQEKRVALDERQTAEVESRLKRARPTFAVPAADSAAPTGALIVSLAELYQFLRCPAEAAVHRHLGLDDEEEVEPQDDEPFYIPLLPGFRLERQFLQRLVRRAMEEGADEALGAWRRWFGELYEDWTLRGRAPAGAFAQVDQARLEERLEGRIAGPGGLAKFLGKRTAAQPCGRVLIGESVAPIGARRTFPALKIVLSSLPHGVRLVGSQAFAWRSDDALDLLVLSTSGKGKVPDDSLSRPMLEPLLFYLALKAGTEPGPEGESSAQWLGEREFRLHVAHDEGIASFSYLPGDVSPDEARSYLAELVRDFLDRGSFDLLPFDLAVSDRGLRLPFRMTDEEVLANYRAFPAAADREARKLRERLGMEEDDPVDPDRPDETILAEFRDRYPERYRIVLDEDQEDDEHPAYRPMKLMQIIQAKVPTDAWDKMRRRFWLLATGPRRKRQHD
jgi:exonuclease V gamma subunit